MNELVKFGLLVVQLLTFGFALVVLARMGGIDSKMFGMLMSW